MYALLILHIIGGFTALSTGIIVLLLKKGTSTHRKLGMLFYFAMLTTGFSAMLLAWYRPSAFLFTIGVFSLYQTISGRRAIQNKTLRPTMMDYMLTLIILLNGGFMISTLNVVLVVFGSLCLLLGVQDLVLYYKLRKNISLRQNEWLARHIGLMMGSFIATATAFIVVNINDFEPAWLLWLAPTFVLTPLMTFWTRKYTRQSL